MKFFLLFLLLFLALFFEATILQLPFVLFILCFLAVVYRSEWVFPVALLSGLVLDALLFRPLGLSSLFFLLFLFLVFLYEKKLELRSIWFVGMICGFGTICYVLFFGYSFLIMQIILSICLSVLLFLGFSLFNPEAPKEQLGTWKK